MSNVINPPSVMRWIVTHVCPSGRRVMSFPRQGCNTYASEAQALDFMGRVQSINDVDGIFGTQAIGTFEAREVECWPGGFDPVGVFEE
jgi:hypothetical protein